MEVMPSCLDTGVTVMMLERDWVERQGRICRTYCASWSWRRWTTNRPLLVIARACSRWFVWKEVELEGRPWV
jgi:hypothetical protein